LPFCGKCGSELDEGDRFCRNCGSSLQPTLVEEFSVAADDLVAKVKELIHEGNVRRIVVKDETGKTLIEIPVTIGVVGALLAPWLAALGAIAAFATNCTIIVVRSE
jgi:hypothetical protein